MKTRNCLISLGLIVCALAFGNPDQGSCAIRFDCTATVHDFHGTVSAEPFAVDFGKDGSQLAAEIDVKVVKMDTDNDKRDTDMRKMFDAVKFPTIHGSVHGTTAAAAAGKLPMTLRISGVTHEVDVTVSNWQRKDGKIAFDASFPVSLKAYKLKAPRILFIKVGDEVKVSAHFELPEPLAGGR